MKMLALFTALVMTTYASAQCPNGRCGTIVSQSSVIYSTPQIVLPQVAVQQTTVAIPPPQIVVPPPQIIVPQVQVQQYTLPPVVLAQAYPVQSAALEIVLKNKVFLEVKNHRDDGRNRQLGLFNFNRRRGNSDNVQRGLFNFNR